MTPHVTARCPLPKDAPCLYRLADGVDRFAEIARAICWAALPVDEGRVISYSPVLPGPWRAHSTWHPPVAIRGDTPVQVQFANGEQMTGTADEFTWAQGIEGDAAIAQYRVLHAAPTVASTSSGASSGASRRAATPRARPRRHRACGLSRWAIPGAICRASDRMS